MKRFSVHQLALIICLVFTLTASVAQAQTSCAVSGDVTSLGTPLAGNKGDINDQILLTHGAELSRQLGVYPAIFYLQEAGNPNAFATSNRYPNLLAAEGRPYYDGPDGTVLIGLQLLDTEWRATSGTGQSIAPIEAHEFTHIAQNKYGFPYQGKWRELHADYVAGWYTAHTCRAGNCNPYQAMANFFYKGGGDHGTREERATAFAEGFKLNRDRGIDSGMLAYQYGVQYISALVAYSR